MAGHDILFKKLEPYGVRGLASDWFKPYLSDRKHFISVNGHDSNLASVLYSASQSSTLSPFLFLININDLSQDIEFVKFIILLITQTFFISVNL